jgi:hypothetical protein
MASKDTPRGETVLKLTLLKYPSSFTALNNLVALAYQRGDTARVDSLIASFRQKNYNDLQMIKSLDDMVQRLRQMPAAPPKAQ